MKTFRHIDPIVNLLIDQQQQQKTKTTRKTDQQTRTKRQRRNNRTKRQTNWIAGAAKTRETSEERTINRR
jgi:broad specificity polyphosphatase/5'/3'-nucleotidase SurE